MPDVLIISSSSVSTTQPLDTTPSLELKKAILGDSGIFHPSSASGTGVCSGLKQVDVWTVSELEARSQELIENPARILCPLTLDVPDWLPFPQKDVFAGCTNIQAVRQQVSGWQFSTADGNHWLPIVLTAKGVLFGEVITQVTQPVTTYQQPLHLVDAQRQPLYQLGQRLMQSLEARPGVYLLQFGLQDDEVLFDRLIPFPDWPAIASLGVQSPDLYRCHWRCLTHQPIRDLMI